MSVSDTGETGSALGRAPPPVPEGVVLPPTYVAKCYDLSKPYLVVRNLLWLLVCQRVHHITTRFDGLGS
jgi:hypothetical protein